MLQIYPIALLQDNYAYLIYDQEKNLSLIIDPSESKSVIDFLDKHNLGLNFIFNTHHHHDHTDGNIELKDKYGAKIYGFSGDKNRISGMDHGFNDWDIFLFGNYEIQVIYIPGHTMGHIAYYIPKVRALFSGDTLFLMGCGRNFEGSFEDLYNSLQKLMKLPIDTKIYPGHEYTYKNGLFCQTIEPDNQALINRMEEVKSLHEEGKSTIPGTLHEEMATNIFLRAGVPEVMDATKAYNGLESFRNLRILKNNF